MHTCYVAPKYNITFLLKIHHPDPAFLYFDSPSRWVVVNSCNNLWLWEQRTCSAHVPSEECRTVTNKNSAVVNHFSLPPEPWCFFNAGESLFLLKKIFSKPKTETHWPETQMVRNWGINLWWDSIVKWTPLLGQRYGSSPKKGVVLVSGCPLDQNI